MVEITDSHTIKLEVSHGKLIVEIDQTGQCITVTKP